MQNEPRPPIALAHNELHRPQLHFTPARGWLNDPNGLVYYQGEYHLFFQHFPDDTTWGPMHWGHAVSPDLVNWTYLPIALHPDHLGFIFSGSAVIDWHNTAGFGRDAMVAIFTHHDPRTARQRQSLAYSTDFGRSWIKYAGNPVLSPPDHLTDFRDPKVFWYEPENGAGYWVMAVATTAAVLFYTSSDLRRWRASGKFGDGQGATSGVWECPDLFALRVPGSDKTRWVLIVGVGDGAPAGGSGEQYFIGHFDGHTFHSENDMNTVLWFDYGADAYATQSWSDAPDGRRLAISWMNNWSYGRALPTEPWRGAMTLPRELGLQHTPAGLRLTQQPVRELESLRHRLDEHPGVTLPVGENIVLPAPGPLLELHLVAQLLSGNSDLQIRLCFGREQWATAGYEAGSQTLYLDRRTCGPVELENSFGTRHDAPLALTNGTLQLRLIVDQSSVEIFAGDGLLSLTDWVFPLEPLSHIELRPAGTAVTIRELSINALKPARFFQGR